MGHSGRADGVGEVECDIFTSLVWASRRRRNTREVRERKGGEGGEEGVEGPGPVLEYCVVHCDFSGVVEDVPSVDEEGEGEFEGGEVECETTSPYQPICSRVWCWMGWDG